MNATGLFWCSVNIGSVNPTPPGQNGRHFADDIFKHTFLNEKFRISIQTSLKSIPKGPIDYKTLVQVMAWGSTSFS